MCIKWTCRHLTANCCLVSVKYLWWCYVLSGCILWKWNMVEATYVCMHTKHTKSSFADSGYLKFTCVMCEIISLHCCTTFCDAYEKNKKFSYNCMASQPSAIIRLQQWKELINLWKLSYNLNYIFYILINKDCILYFNFIISWSISLVIL